MATKKLSTIIALLGFVQFCFGAAISASEEESSCATLGNFHYFLLTIRTIDAQKVDELIEILSKCDNTETVNYEIFVELLFRGTNVSKEQQLHVLSPYFDDMTQDDLPVIERKLNNRLKLKPQQTEKIMSILQKLTDDSDEETVAEGIVEFLVHAVNRIIGRPEDVISKQSVFDFFVKNSADLDQDEDSNTWISILDRLMEDDLEETNHIISEPSSVRKINLFMDYDYDSE